jgi:hypothetical protein
MKSITFPIKCPMRVATPKSEENPLDGWFAQYPEIDILDWPAKSSDLNLIENIWAMIANS